MNKKLPTDFDIDSDFIVDQLTEVCSEAFVHSNGTEIAIICPFHNDTNPSCNVHLTGHKTGVGAYHCWACDARGPWHVLAARLGLNSGQYYHPENPFRAKAKAIQLRKKAEQDLREHTFRGHIPIGCVPWEYGAFRELPEEFLVKNEAKRYYDENDECYRIVFPVKNRIGSIVGSVGRRLDKGTKRPWLNSPGDWASKALYPLNTEFKVPKTVVLVEGPYDALRLLYYGIPALSILGATNWAPLKMSMLEALGVKNIVICMDGDEAGRRAEYKIFEATERRFKRKRFRLPIEDPAVDPGNMDKERLYLLKEVRDNF